MELEFLVWCEFDVQNMFWYEEWFASGTIRERIMEKGESFVFFVAPITFTYVRVLRSCLSSIEGDAM